MTELRTSVLSPPPNMSRSSSQRTFVLLLELLSGDFEFWPPKFALFRVAGVNGKFDELLLSLHVWGDELNGAAALILEGFADLLEITSDVCAVNAGCAVVGGGNAHFAGGAVIEGFAASVVCIVKDAGFAVSCW